MNLVRSRCTSAAFRATEGFADKALRNRDIFNGAESAAALNVSYASFNETVSACDR